MSLSFTQTLKNKLLESGEVNIQSNEDLKGFSQEEISAVMERQGVNFIPTIYRAFLSEMGHFFGNESVGYTLNYDRLLLMKQHFMLLVAESSYCSKHYQPFEDIFLFACSYEDYWFFRTHDENDDPPVYFYHECFSDALQIAPRLSEWFLIQVFYGPRRWADEHFSGEMRKLWD